MASMSSRERVRIALSHREPDRVPFSLGGTAQKISNSTTLKLLEYYNITERPQKVLAGLDFMYYSLPLMQKLGVDVAYLYLEPPAEFKYYDEPEYVDEWGLTHRRFENFIALEGAPLKNADIRKIKNYQGPNPYDPNRVFGLREKAKVLFEETDMELAIHRPTPGGIFEMACWLRGTEKFYMDLALNKKLAHTLLDKLLEIHLGFYEVQVNAVGNYVKIYEITDDLGGQQGLLISRDMYREFIKPRHKQLIDFIKSRVPGAKIFYHSDGAIAELIPDFIEIGIDILSPVQPLAAGMNSEILKKKYGKDIVFQGGIDVQEALRGDRSRVEAEVKRRLKDFAPNGGYIAGPSHDLGKDIPLENIILAVNLVKKYGKYPLDIS